ncbi:NAD(+) diphosphatase [Aliiglaciecola lipolytica]|uniref:NAD(+) diphosphatase n=1 Tax=Aliiglaciecola lipolytica E3 TaxID=1127673 RepID=K6YAF7_9ALTE|nr:NAD(+) diphosphatase [Aliiglaciecola lipolytica]GAC13648.1 NAD+ diphosphatase [Aliiglaciecola lipolytica E3]
MLINIDEIGVNSEVHWIIFMGDRVVANKQQQALLKSTWQDLPIVHHYNDQIISLGEYQGAPCLAIDVGNEQLELEEFETISLRGIYLSENFPLFQTVARAWQWILFRRTHRFCGQCGSTMQQVDWEMATQCFNCHHRCYPRVSPCIIVSIRKGDKILLAQGKAQRERKIFSTLAGFVESGESLEQAVHREVFEEVGIKIKNIEYFDSQPWPFPHSLMMGFIAEHDSGEIEVDGDEILEAHWYEADKLPLTPPTISIAGQLIKETLSRIANLPTSEFDNKT